MIRSFFSWLFLAAIGFADGYAASEYDRVSPSVIDAIAPVVAVAGLATVLVIGVMGSRTAPRGRSGR